MRAFPHPADLRGFEPASVESPEGWSPIDRYFPTKTETARKDGLDPTGEAIGVVTRKYYERRRLSTLDTGGDWTPLPKLMTVSVRGEGTKLPPPRCRRRAAYSLAKTETASEGGLDPTVESIEVVDSTLPQCVHVYQLSRDRASRSTIRCPFLERPQNIEYRLSFQVCHFGPGLWRPFGCGHGAQYPQPDMSERPVL